MNGAELRKHRRFNLSLPVRVRVKTEAAESQLPGSTKDIGAAGVYLVMPQALEPGSELEFEITLPGEVSGGRSIRLCCRGRVLRVNHQEAENKVGVAATIERYEFAPSG